MRRVLASLAIVSWLTLSGAPTASAADFDHRVRATIGVGNVVTVEIAGVSKYNPITVFWNQTTNGPATKTRCTKAKATATPFRCVATAKHAYPAPGQYRVGLQDKNGRTIIQFTIPGGSTGTPDTGGTPIVKAVPADWEAQMLEQVNAARAKVGARPVTLCAPLSNAAQGYANTMARNSHYSHIGPDGSNPNQRAIAAGYFPDGLSENIGRGRISVTDIMAGWIASPHHYDTLTDTYYTHVGFGVADGESRYWVQDFGSGRGC